MIAPGGQGVTFKYIALVLDGASKNLIFRNLSIGKSITYSNALGIIRGSSSGPRNGEV